MQRFVLDSMPVNSPDLAITAVQLAASERLTAMLDTHDLPVVLVALAGTELWLPCASEYDWSDDNEHLDEISTLGTDAIALLLVDREEGRLIMLSADRDGRCGLSNAVLPDDGERPNWYCPPGLVERAYEILSPFQDALGVPASKRVAA